MGSEMCIRDRGTGTLPDFDVLMLGVGEDGHVASVFPGQSVGHRDQPVGAVRESPKPPPVRLTLSLATINTAAEIWLVASGAGKGRAVGQALAGAEPEQVPAAGVRGVRRTLWLLDRAAAADLPARTPSAH